jgi:hypothetical protein
MLAVDLTKPTDTDTKLEASVGAAFKTGMKMIEQRVSVETGISKTLKSALEAGLQEAMEKCGCSGRSRSPGGGYKGLWGG